MDHYTDTDPTPTRALQRDIVKTGRTWAVVVIFTSGTRPFWHEGFTTRAEAANLARYG